MLVSISVLGPLTIAVDGEETVLPPAQRRVLAILAAANGGAIAQEALVRRMWPKGAPATANTSIQVHVSGIRSKTPDILKTTDTGYRLDLDAVELDTSILAQHHGNAEQALRKAAWDEAIDISIAAASLWRGDPFPELAGDPDVTAQVIHLEETKLAMTEIGIEARIALGRVREVVPELRSQTNEHPLRERLWYQLMLALYLSGRQAEALRTYQEARKILAEELGIEPSTALKQLEERILLESPELGIPASTATVSSLPAPIKRFVGRASDLRRARSLLDDRGVVVVGGAAGIGKTAFSDILADEWRARGGQVLELRGTHGLQRVPFGALAAVVPLEVAGSETETIAQAMASIIHTGESTMTVVDDAHLLDPQSAALISSIAQSPGVQLVISVTSGEHLPTDITTIWARWPDCRIDLDPLTRDEVGEMTAALLDETLDESILDAISSTTLGYPLYVAAIAAEVADRIENAGEDRSAVVRDLLRSSDRLIRLLERRLSRLSREERRLFDAIALAETVPSDVVEAMDEAGALAQLETSGLVRVGPQHVEATHPLLATVADETLTLEGRRGCAQRLLEAIDRDTEPVDVASLVRTALSVGVIPDAGKLQVAASVALAWADFTGAAKIAAHAPNDQQLIVLRARALRFLGEIPDEVDVEMDESARTEFLSARSQAMAYGERRFSEAIDMLHEGMASLTESTHRNRLAIELLILSGLSGDMDALLGASRTVDDEADPATRLMAFAVTQLAEALTLSTSSAPETYARGRKIAESVGTDSLLFEQLEMSRALVDLADGRFVSARVRLSESEGKKAVGSWLTIESVMADAWSSAPEALRLAESAVAALEAFDPIGNLAQARLVVELRRAQMGNTVPGNGVVEYPIEFAAAEIDRIMSQRAQAWYAWTNNDPTAGKRLIEIGREAVALGHRFWGLSCFLDAVRLGHGENVRTDIDHQVITRGAGLATIADHHARSETQEDLVRVARMWWEAGAPTYAIETAIKAAEPAELIDCARVQLMAAKGSDPLVGEIAEIEKPLSSRQAEIVLSVVGGASNEETADAIFVSRRTVEDHLRTTYRTLDIGDGRDGLKDLFGWL